MSYARWSDDMHRSDVYVYESDWGFEVHVATHRVNFDREAVGDNPGYLDPKGYLAWRRRLSAAVEAAEHYRVPIGLSRDGRSFIATLATDCADLLRSLRAEGYHVPDGTIEEILDVAGIAS